jgi:predicted Fe-Mo cluster-binding NifX family protein
MKVAIPVFKGRISPVFDWSRELLLLDIESGEESVRREISLEGLDPLQRVEQLAAQRVELLVCGGISEMLLSAIETCGIRVFPWVAGSLDEVLADLLSTGSPGPQLVMPGCRRRGGPGRGAGRMGNARGQGRGGQGRGFGRGGKGGGKGRGFAGGRGNGFTAGAGDGSDGGKGAGTGRGGKRGKGRGWKQRPE